MKSESIAGDRPQCLERKLPAGLCHVGEVMPLVLARYGLSFEERPDAEPPVVANETPDFFDVSMAALESVLAN
jgi:hypothetical protein